MRQPQGVAVENYKGWIRLRWRDSLKRRSISLGLEHNTTNLRHARRVAKLIEDDLSFGEYDPTLRKYRPFSSRKDEITVPELFQRWTKHVADEKSLSARSLDSRYQSLERSLVKHLNVSAHAVTVAQAKEFASVCGETLQSSQTAKARLGLLTSCWTWAIQSNLVAEPNPWIGLAGKIRKTTTTRQVKPFSVDEIRQILAGFESNEYYGHYSALVQFLFATAVRPGEAFALQWQDVAQDFRSVTIRRSVSRGHFRDSTKTGKDRTVFLNPAIATMLEKHHDKNPHSMADLVFPSPQGKPLDDHNFSRRAWRSVLESVGVEYRSPYTVRHSVISHALASGANPTELSHQTGHSVEVMLKTYAHQTQNENLFPVF